MIYSGFQIPDFYARLAACVWISLESPLVPHFPSILTVSSKPAARLIFAQISGTLDMPTLTLRFFRLEHCRPQVRLNYWFIALLLLQRAWSTCYEAGPGTARPPSSSPRWRGRGGGAAGHPRERGPKSRGGAVGHPEVRGRRPRGGTAGPQGGAALPPGEIDSPSREPYRSAGPRALLPGSHPPQQQPRAANSPTSSLRER